MVRVRELFQKDLKNRSSKHLKFMTGPGTKSILKCVSNEQLKRWVAAEVKGAAKELRRRESKNSK